MNSHVDLHNDLNSTKFMLYYSSFFNDGYFRDSSFLCSFKLCVDSSLCSPRYSFNVFGLHNLKFTCRNNEELIQKIFGFYITIQNVYKDSLWWWLDINTDRSFSFFMVLNCSLFLASLMPSKYLEEPYVPVVMRKECIYKPFEKP